ncbi:MAG: hypothetical protein ACLP01_08065 [Solirubrobacteraceae bacterium]
MTDDEREHNRKTTIEVHGADDAWTWTRAWRRHRRWKREKQLDELMRRLLTVRPARHKTEGITR